MKGTVKHEILRLLLEYVYFKTKRGKSVTLIKDSHNDNDQKGHKIFEVQRLQKTIDRSANFLADVFGNALQK